MKTIFFISISIVLLSWPKLGLCQDMLDCFPEMDSSQHYEVFDEWHHSEWVANNILDTLSPYQIDKSYPFGLSLLYDSILVNNRNELDISLTSQKKLAKYYSNIIATVMGFYEQEKLLPTIKKCEYIKLPTDMDSPVGKSDFESMLINFDSTDQHIPYFTYRLPNIQNRQIYYRSETHDGMRNCTNMPVNDTANLKFINNQCTTVGYFIIYNPIKQEATIVKSF